ncbi:hypothetical protein ACFLTE_01845 [Bacteroidota bacterium]
MENINQHSLYKKYDSDTVISETFRFYKKHFKILFLVSFIVSFLIQIPFYQLGIYNQNYLINETFQMPDKEIIMTLMLMSLFMLIIYTIAYLFICIYVYKQEQENSSFISLLGSTIKDYYLKFIGAGIIVMFILMIGGLAGVVVFVVGILVTFFYFMTVLSPVAPILIIENKDVFQTIGRSFKLTHKDFWGALGAILLLILLYIVISIVISIFTVIPFAFDVIKEIMNGTNFIEILKNGSFINSKMTVIGLIFNIVFSALTFPIFPVFSVILYFKLKYAEDNKEPDFEKYPS